MKKNLLLTTHKKSILILIIFLSLIISFNNSYCQYRKSSDQLRRELRQVEENSPLNYVKAYGINWSVNLASNTVVKGYIKNYATIARYKNIALKATFTTKTGVYVGEETWGVLKFLAPGSVIDFRRTITGYWKDADMCSVEIISVELD